MLKWFSKRLKEAQEKDGQAGFTLIELLVVVIIIGILAAIAIPVFLSQREKAWEAGAQSELRNMAAAATSCSADNDGAYTGTVDCHDTAVLDGYGWTNDSKVDQAVTSGGNASEWSATSQHTLDDTTYEFSTVGEYAGEVTEQ